MQHVFNFTREVLTAPLDPGSVVVSLSSGAALVGSPLSGGYAGAKATMKLISSYAGLEARRLGANIRFLSVLPQLTPATGLGKLYTERYAAMAGMSEAQFLDQRFGGALRPEQVGENIADLAVDDSYSHPAYLLGRRPAVSRLSPSRSPASSPTFTKGCRGPDHRGHDSKRCQVERVLD